MATSEVTDLGRSRVHRSGAISLTGAVFLFTRTGLRPSGLSPFGAVFFHWASLWSSIPLYSYGSLLAL